MERILRIIIAFGLLILAADIYFLHYSNNLIRKETKRQEEQEEKEGVDYGFAVKTINI